jgi:hypothetical protein
MRDIVSPLMGLRSPFGQRVDQYKAAGFRPTLVADMSKDYYRSTSRQTFDDLFTHSRLGNATMVDSDGLLKWGPHNLLTYSEDFSNAAWTKVSGTGTLAIDAIGPDGQTSAVTLVDNEAGGAGFVAVQRSVNVSAATNYTFSAFLKADGLSWAYLFCPLFTTPASGGAFFNLSTGEIGTVDAGFTASVQDFGDGWYCCSVSFTTDATDTSGRVDIWAAEADGDYSVDLDGTSSILVYGAHLYRSDLGGMAPVPVDARVAGSTTYVPTTSTAKYLPRRHNHVYNGTAWVDAGTLIETEARTNLITYSQDFTDASWITNSTTVSSSAGTLPIGSGSVFKITEDGTLGVHQIYGQNVSGVQTVTVSGYFKAAEYSVFQLTVGAATNQPYANFDLASQSVTASGNGGTGLIENVGAGWFRCSLTGLTTANGSWMIFLTEGNATAARGPSYTGDGTSGIYIYGAQLEAASTPSSYIQTSGSTVTRAADTSGLTIPAYSTTRTTGSELVTNGTFDTDSDWTKGGSWLISGGQATQPSGASANYITQADMLTVGKVYQYSVEVVSGNASNFPQLYTEAGLVASFSGGPGTYTGTFTAAGNDLRIRAVSPSLDVTIDNISVKEAARIAPWPTPRVIGEELVVNGGFDSDASGWTADADGTIAWDAGAITYTGVAVGPTFMSFYQDVAVSAGSVYQISFDITDLTPANEVRLQMDGANVITGASTVGSYSAIYVASSSTEQLGIGIVGGLAGETFSIDNISVKEIDPLVVAIQVSGRMTYADEGAQDTVRFLTWQADVSNYIRQRIDTNSTNTGAFFTLQNSAGTLNLVAQIGGQYSPGVNVPFNIASYHGSTFINGAVGGTALTANTNPTALPDLSSTDLSVGYDFMGNIEQVSIWVGGITDVTSGNLLISEASS